MLKKAGKSEGESLEILSDYNLILQLSTPRLLQVHNT